MSNDAVNNQAAQLGRGVVTIVPVTSDVERVYRFQVLLPAGTGGLTRDSKAQAQQIRAVDAVRIGRRLGALSVDTMASLDRALRLHLDL